MKEPYNHPHISLSSSSSILERERERGGLERETAVIGCIYHRSNGDFRVGVSTTSSESGGSVDGSGVREMRLVWIHGGMHAGVHIPCSWEVPRAVDMRTLRGGGEGRSHEIREGHHHRGGAEPPHQFLQRLQIFQSTKCNGASYLRYRPPFPPELGLAEISPVHSLWRSRCTAGKLFHWVTMPRIPR